ncbi:hypothetical protein [Acidocella aromatica]|uniref:Uncharacterized protein n=1 Tax=Acidocella aromatica TaxID=1303579 RepID=A0A840VL34_9PROT|nr:hypothetical protein [Acidocella aromatica]MBB5372281.1 hypothetical protein [Acidocella aromatica]
MPTFDVQGALGAGYSPSQVVDYLSAQPQAGFDFSGARKAGYSDQQILDEYAKGNPNASSTSPLAAARNSAGSIVSGLGNLATSEGEWSNAHLSGNGLGATIGRDLLAPGSDPNAPGAMALSAGQALRGAGQSIAGSQQYDGQSIHRLGADLARGNLGGAAYDAAGGLASAAPYAAAALVPYAGPAALGASGAGNTIQDRVVANGENAPSAGDLLAGGASAALNAGLGPLSRGVMGPAGAPVMSSISNPIARAGARLGLSGLSGAAVGAGNTALSGNADPSTLLNAAVEGAGTGALAAGATGAIGSGKDALGNWRLASQAGPDVQAYAKASSDWTAAMDQQRQAVMRDNPNLAPEQVDAVAQQRAQQAGATPPTYDQLTPSAQRGLAQMGVLQLYQQRLQAGSTNMGKDPSDLNPSTVFKDVLGDLTSNLNQTGDLLVRSGQITADQGKLFQQAVAEAQKGNRNPGAGGADLGYFDTLRDKVAGLPVDQATRNTLLLNLQMADIAEDNSWKQASMGPLEKNAKMASGALGSGLGFLLGTAAGAHTGMPGLEEFGIQMGGLGGYAKDAMVRSGLRSLDQLMGNQLPPILRNQAQVEQYAAQNGLQAGGAPGDLMALQGNLQSQVAGQQAAQQAAKAAQAPVPLSPVQKGQQQAATSLAATIGRFGPDHPLGMQAMQDLNGMGQQQLIAQALARYNGLGGLRGVQDQMTAQQATMDAAQAMAALKAKQAAQGNAQAVKDDATVARLNGAAAKSQLRQAYGENPGNMPNVPGTVPMAQASVPQGPSSAPSAAMSLLNAALNKQAAQKQAAATAQTDNIKSAFPVLGTAWQNAISKNTGLPVSFIQDHLQGLVDNGQLPADLHQTITNADTLPGPDYHRLGDYFQGLAGSPDAPDASAPAASSGPDTSGVRNKQSYAANLRAADRIHQDVLTRNPDLADKANALAAIKTVEGRQQALAGWLAAETDPAEQARLEEVLGPMTQFGWKPSSGTPDPRIIASSGAKAALNGTAGAPPASSVVLRAGLGLRPGH